jgi:hypothetical protein
MTMSDDLRSLTELDRLIHEPARLLIVTILSTVKSADLSKLEDAGYVNIEKTFKGKLPLTVCKLTEAGQRAFDGYRLMMQNFIAKTG